MPTFGVFLLSDGKLNHRPLEEHRERQKAVTLGEMFAGYRESYPKRAKEASTLYTERIHMAHLERIIGTTAPLHSVTAKKLQDYVVTRSKERSKFGRTIGSRTIKKEIGTFTAVWNQWAVPQGLASGRAPTGALNFDKERAKPPFQTREQIERQIARGGLSDDDEEALWDCLFLTLPEVGDVLDYVHRKKCPPYVYPLFVFAAHTGARRSEMLRSRVTDFDFDANAVTIREKKREHGKEETYRTVPMTPALAKAMQEWFARHPGGAFTVCTQPGQPLLVHLVAETFVRVLKNSKWSVLPGWHCFRHSFISNCVAKGIDQRLIDQWVGHTTDAMHRRYSHLIPKTSQEALRKVFA